MINIENTEIAFKSKSNFQLKKAKWLFKIIEYPLIVKFSELLLKFAIKIHFPVNWIIKPTIFNHFCGGETIEECKKTIQFLGISNIGTILDFSVEGSQKESDFENTKKEILKIIEEASVNKNIPFCVFKATGLARFELLEKISSQKQLTLEEEIEFEKVRNRIDELCKASYTKKTPIFIDAEESWIQDCIDLLAEDMMMKYNIENTIVYNTIQMYRNDRLDYLQKMITESRNKNFKLGFKIVRGAYMEKERERASKLNYPSPIYENKELTDNAYNNAIEICLKNADIVSLCAGTHNETSSLLLSKLINQHNYKINDKRFYYAQLYGMSDHISFNLADANYNVAKYVPYGPVKFVLPYLIRRAQENTSVARQTGRELMLINREIRRRNKNNFKVLF